MYCAVHYEESPWPGVDSGRIYIKREGNCPSAVCGVSVVLSDFQIATVLLYC
jgi:hypothetical protein